MSVKLVPPPWGIEDDDDAEKEDEKRNANESKTRPNHDTKHCPLVLPR